MNKARLNTLIVLFCMAALGILFRAVQLQVFPHQKLEQRAKYQHEKRIELVGRRGVIRDRNSIALAVSLNAQSLYANPLLIKSVNKNTRAVAKALGLNEDVLRKKIELARQKNQKFIWLQRQMNDETLQQFKTAFPKGIEGFGLVPESRREYPLGETARNLLGVTSVDGLGIEGAELSFNSKLHGEKATVRIPRDALGRPLVFQDSIDQSDVNPGDDIHLSLDSRLQYTTEKILQASLKEHKAKNALAIVMNPKTGELLTLASLPNENLRNPSISDPIEPGSVVKPFVVAKALENKIVTPNTILSGGGGFIKVGNKLIGEADAKHRYESISVSELIRISSNVATVNLVKKLGFENLFSTYEQLGFTQKTGIELKGESRGILQKPSAKQVLEQATLGFGQGMALTPLQIVQGFSVFANQGVRVTPTILKKSGEAQGNQRIFSKETIKKMLPILENVVEQEGTGRFAKVRGVTVAGKTGTSQKVDYEKGGYKKGAYWSSFIGFLPSQNPQFLIYVLLDEPQGINPYGGTVAAPAFSKIAEAALRLEEKNRETPTEKPKVNLGEAPRFLQKNKVQLELAPDLRGLKLQEALKQLEPFSVTLDLRGDGSRVEQQTPEPGTPLSKNSTLKLLLR